jgi:L-seryl-tRNA(Ser) seleniumtransferase
MITAPKSEVARRARAVAKRLRAVNIETELADDVSYAGGGALPLAEIPTSVLRLRIRGTSAAKLAQQLRNGDPPVIGRIADGALVLDLRTVAPAEVAELAAAVQRAAQ